MADVDVHIEFQPEGFQGVLNSAGVVAVLNDVADGVVSRGHGVLKKHGFTATKFPSGSRPAVSVWTRSATKLAASLDRKVLEGAI